METGSRNDITELLQTVEGGDSGSISEVFQRVYDELRRIAHHQMSSQPSGHTLQPTALVHEAYLKLVGQKSISWESRRHFFSAAAQAMRHILVDQARRHQAKKRSRKRSDLSLDQLEVCVSEHGDGLLQLDEALQRLGKVEARSRDVVILRFFSGLSIEETARALGTSVATVKRDWIFARAWLHKEMREAGAG